MISKDFSVTNKRGIKLAATIDMPDSEADIRNYALSLHCFTCSKELKSIPNINSVLVGSGFAVVRFDMTGIGSSEGEFKNTNFTTQLEDTENVIEYMKQNYGFPELVIGHSIGRNAAVFSAAKYNEIKAIVIIGTASEPVKLAQKLKRTRERSIAEGSAKTEIGGVSFEFTPQFFEDLEKYHMKSVLQNLTRPLLIMHSPADSYSDISNASEIFRNARHPKSFISLDDIDHLILNKKDAEFVGEVIGAWSKKYCGERSGEESHCEA